MKPRGKKRQKSKLSPGLQRCRKSSVYLKWRCLCLLVALYYHCCFFVFVCSYNVLYPVLMLFIVCVLQKQDEGVVLLDRVCDHVGLQERQLFSLQIRETSTAITSITANTHSPVSSLLLCCTSDWADFENMLLPLRLVQSIITTALCHISAFI